MFVWAAVFTLALPLAQAQDLTSGGSDPSVVSAEPPPACWPRDMEHLSCAQHCMLNGWYPNCGYCSTPCSSGSLIQSTVKSTF